MSFISETAPRARKNHRCQWCFQIIPKGEIHVKFSGTSDGDFYSGRHHNECELAWSEYGQNNDWEYPSETQPRGAIGEDWQ